MNKLLLYNAALAIGYFCWWLMQWLLIVAIAAGLWGLAVYVALVIYKAMFGGC